MKSMMPHLFCARCENLKIKSIFITDYECPMKSFLLKSRTFGINFWYKLLGFSRQIGQINSGVFWAKLSAPILVHVVHVFNYSTTFHFYKKKPLYPHPQYLFEIGFEFGLQKIRDLAFVCP